MLDKERYYDTLQLKHSTVRGTWIDVYVWRLADGRACHVAEFVYPNETCEVYEGRPCLADANSPDPLKWPNPAWSGPWRMTAEQGWLAPDVDSLSRDEGWRGTCAAHWHVETIHDESCGFCQWAPHLRGVLKTQRKV